MSLANASGLDNWEAIAGLGQAELERRLFGACPEQRRVVEPDFGRMHLELRRQGVALVLLWEVQIGCRRICIILRYGPLRLVFARRTSVSPRPGFGQVQGCGCWTCSRFQGEVLAGGSGTTLSAPTK